MVTFSGTYEGGLRCLARHEPSGALLPTDAPKDNLGRGEAFSPTDLVATALATCVVTTMAIAARKLAGTELPPLRWTASKEMTSEAPRRIARLTVDVWLPAAAQAIPRELLEKAARGCPVARSLAPEVEHVVRFHTAMG
jgi:putative redox protein